LGWSGHPQKPKKKKKKKKKTKNGFWPFGGGRTTPKDLGVDSATPKGLFGVAESTPTPPFFLIFSFFIFLFFFFFIKKIMIKWPKRRCFEAQNSVVLEPKTT
jgi:hypothetical protein